ncbi:MAG: hypothetical protein RIR86_1762 [Acidobacteriota bacterium]|jgi:rhamnose transport system permease protein
MPEPTPLATEPPVWQRIFPNREWLLLIVIAAELAVFAVTGENFATTGNGFEILRLSVELGLLTIALTPVIVTGGIDLSVGSMMGLGAIVCGWLWHEQGWSIWTSSAATILVGLLGGGLNGLLIGRLGLPPLIVTLGSFSLYRGLAEGISGGVVSYSGFPANFLFLGQGYWLGFLPPQAPILLLALLLVGIYLHRTPHGRALFAIGYSADGARFAGLPVARRLATVYVLSGGMASLAAIIYIAHLGQAKSDAGSSYELMAITAVVLGGTSIFGGRGTILGSVLGLLAIVILQNGLRLTAAPTELSGILTGLLLLSSILADALTNRAGRLKPASNSGPVSSVNTTEEHNVKNSQVAVLSTVIIAAALLVAGSNWLLVRSLRPAPGATEPRKMTIAVMPKAKGDPYFVSCRKGAEEAARELGIDLIWDGPTELDAARQNEVVEGWITRQVDVIAVSVENQASISTVLRKARERGINVVTWDADAETNARDFFINQATPQGIGSTLTDEAARLLNGSGEFAVITGSLSAANQNEWIKHIRARVAEKYPGLKLTTIQPSEDDRDRAFAQTQTILKVYPEVKVIVGISAPAVPGAAEAVKQAGRADVKVIGLSLPNLCKPYVHDGYLESVVLWDTFNLGYLTVYAGHELRLGKLKPNAGIRNAGNFGRLTGIEVRDDQVILGSPFIFNKGNIDRFDF